MDNPYTVTPVKQIAENTEEGEFVFEVKRNDVTVKTVCTPYGYNSMQHTYGEAYAASRAARSSYVDAFKLVADLS